MSFYLFQLTDGFQIVTKNYTATGEGASLKNCKSFRSNIPDRPTFLSVSELFLKRSQTIENAHGTFKNVQNFLINPHDIFTVETVIITIMVAIELRPEII